MASNQCIGEGLTTLAPHCCSIEGVGAGVGAACNSLLCALSPPCKYDSRTNNKSEQCKPALSALIKLNLHATMSCQEKGLGQAATWLKHASRCSGQQHRRNSHQSLAMQSCSKTEHRQSAPEQPHGHATAHGKSSVTSERYFNGFVTVLAEGLC
jgi:hypothetical protein